MRWAARTLLGCGPRPLRRTLRQLHATEAGVPTLLRLPVGPLHVTAMWRRGAGDP